MVTQEQIARKLGISRQLVTFALAGYPQVSKASRERILKTASAMGYQPNPHARALRHKRTGIIALWIPDLISTHYNHVARELNRLVKHAGQELIISETSPVAAKQILSNVPVDGIIAVDPPDGVQANRLMGARTIPFVTVGANCSAETDSVRVDLHEGSKMLMRHLLDSGFRRIAHATFLQRDPARPDRRQGYQTAMRKAGLKPEYIFYPLTERQRPVTRRLIQDYVRHHGCPEAIFCHSDDAALGVYRGLADLNLRVPDDVAIAGCDGIEDAEYLECPLTTIVQPVSEMCAATWEFLTKRLLKPELKKQTLLLKPRLDIRQSTTRTVSAGTERTASAPPTARNKK